MTCTPTRSPTWKNQLLVKAADVCGGEPRPDSPIVDLKVLHAKIGQLALENDFLEGALIKAGMLEFAFRLARARGRAPRLLQARGHNHMSIVAHFNTGDEALVRAILDFFHSTPGEAACRAQEAAT